MIKWLQRYKIYIIVIFCGLILFLYAELPIIKYFQSISFILTNKVLNDFLIALGTGMIGSSLTALLIDRSHEKQNAVISNMMKRQILYDMLLNLRYWINSDDPIEIFEKKHLVEHVQKVGAYLTKKLEELVEEYDTVKAVKGKGLMQGIQVTKPISEITGAALKEGLLIIGAGSDVIRFVPPLIIELEQVDEMIRILKKAL